mgnify:FL=1
MIDSNWRRIVIRSDWNMNAIGGFYLSWSCSTWKGMMTIGL